MQPNLRTDTVTDPIHDRLAELLTHHPLRAGQFIVTIYGDVVAPRNDALWIGDLIGLCAPLGISETLVRTAMSRLVAAGQMEGERKGRRSYYRLTEAANAEFLAAAQAIYAPRNGDGWRLLWFADPSAALQAIDAAQGRIVALNAQFALGPARGAPPDGALEFAARAEDAPALLRQMARSLWPLEALGHAYQQFLDQAAALADPALAARPDLALTARLLLVHWFRAVALRDPMLPPDALPERWAGVQARAGFATLYLALSKAADSQIAATLQDARGPLPQLTPALQARYDALTTQAGTQTEFHFNNLPKASQQMR